MDHSEKLGKYFELIEREVAFAYSVAQEARKKGFDPEEIVSIPLAKNMAERVEGLVSVVEPNIRGSGVSQRINELEEKYGKLSWKVAFVISLETAQEKFCKLGSKHRAMEIGIRVGLAYLTLGVVASPLEGFVELKLKKRMDDGKEYFCLMFSGPIRSAGGTGAAVSVLVADYIRKQMGYAQYDATEQEIKRAVTELNDYHERITNLQYLPSEEEIEFMVKNMPVQVDGDASEDIEVSNYKDLPRIETNIIRNGFCLVLGECLCQKSQKLWKQLSSWGKEFGMEQWNFLEEFLKIQKLKKSKQLEKKSDLAIKPDYTYIHDLVAGRPILGFPLRNGGFRLRYGRCRNSGYSSAAMHPALTYILDKYIAIGTQLKLERPGKAASMSTCDSIEGPLVKLEDGSVVRVNSVALAKQINPKVTEILYLGDILINYGDFFNRAHSLVPAGYCEEWWALEIEKQIRDKFEGDYNEAAHYLGFDLQRLKSILNETFESSISGEEAIHISEKLSVPIHPKYTYYWNTLTLDDSRELILWVKNGKIIREKDKIDKIVIEYMDKPKRSLELLGVPHTSIGKEFVVINTGDACSLLRQGVFKEPLDLLEKETLSDAISRLSGIKIRDRCGIFIGARMGRPEKAKVRKLDGQPHCLFPVGEEGGRLRCFQSSIEKGVVTSDFPMFKCGCGNETVFSVCEICGARTEKIFFCKICGPMKTLRCPKHGENKPFKHREIDIRATYEAVLKNLKLDNPPDLVKGVRGTSNKEHVPEHLGKGILRSYYNIPVNKDGTTRYDMTQLAITHFKPVEVGASIEKLRALGYDKDMYGQELSNVDQVIELFPQDIILPECEDSNEEGADKVLLRVAQFIDSLLVKLYGLKPSYNVRTKEDLIGQFVLVLAPHTSAGIMARIVGFSKTQGLYAHPLLHAATRRDCLGYDTYVPVECEGKWEIKKIGDFIENENPIKQIDGYGTKGKQVSGVCTWGNPGKKVIKEITKHPARNILRLHLEDGRKLEVTEGHKLYLKGKIETKALNLKQGDKVMVSYKKDIEEKDINSLYLPEIFYGKKDIMIRNVRKFLGLNKHSNYSFRDSFPISFVKAELEKKGMSLRELPANAMIACKRDKVRLPVRIELSGELLEIIGLYIAEGYSRKNESKKGFYQISIAGREEIKSRVKYVFMKYFGLKPSYENSVSVTFSSKLVYEIVNSYLGCGSNAHEKRIPSLLLNLKKDKIAAVLRGYFEGDGSVSKADIRVSCDTASEGLKHDISFVLSRFGIYTKYYEYEKEPGPKVRESYIRKNRKIPKFKITKITIPSNFVAKFEPIGFLSSRKKEILKDLCAKKPRGMNMELDANYTYPSIVKIESMGKKESYCFNVSGEHNFFANEVLVHNCDGDEACVTLLLDALLNFSRKYLPNTRGATQDAPLVLTSKLTPSEVDDMVFDIDVCNRYPLELYEAGLAYKKTSEVNIEQIGKRLNTEKQYEGMGFTHNTSNINSGVRCSAYKLLPTMEDKLKGQMTIASKIRAVDEAEVAKIVIEKHFIKDIRGNLRKFSMQEFRCSNCNDKYRRPPLMGKCIRCGGNIIFTISEGSIVKYLEPALSLANHYNLPAYLKQSLVLTKLRVESMFGKDKEKQEGLGRWFG